jgi:hypothetical protein
MQITVRWVAAAALMMLAAQVRASCTFGASGEPSLQSVFDAVVSPGSLSAANDRVSDALWTTQGRAAATIIVELAGFASSNLLGIYDPLNPKSRQVSVFAGSATSGSTTTLQLIPNGAGYDVIANDTVEGHFASSAFGFFLHTPQNQTFFSQPALNGDRADHMYAYRGNGGLFGAGLLAGTAFATSMYLLAPWWRRDVAILTSS